MSSIRLTKAGKFEARVRFGIRRVSKTFDVRSAAEHWASGVECGAINPSVHPRGGPLAQSTRGQGTPGECLLAQALSRYADEVIRHHKGGAKALYRVRELQSSWLGPKRFSDITPADVRALRDAELARGCSGSTVARKLSILSAFYNHAIQEWEAPIRNPVSLIRRPGPNPARVRRISEQEIDALLVACGASKTPWLTEVVTVALETGMRRGELLALAWTDIDNSKRLISLADSKNGHPRYIPLSPRAQHALTVIQRSGAVKPIPLTLSALEQAWKRAVERSGATGLRFHDLRHEALSRWAHLLGGDTFKLCLISGHRSLEMAKRYVHPSQVELISTAFTPSS